METDKCVAALVYCRADCADPTSLPTAPCAAGSPVVKALLDDPAVQYGLLDARLCHGTEAMVGMVGALPGA